MSQHAAPDTDAAYYCRRCDRPLNEHEIKHIVIGKSTTPMCLKCGGPASSRLLAQPFDDPSNDPAALLPKLMSSFGYVLRSDGLIAAAGLGLGMTLAGYLPIVGGVLAAGMALTYLFAIIQHTTRDDDDLPLPVDFISWGDLAVPFIRFLTALVVAALPAIAGITLRGGALNLPLQFLEAVLCLVSVAYVPAAVAQAALSSGWFGAVNPLPGISLVARIPRDYGVTVFVLAGLGCFAMVISAIAALAARTMHVIPVFPTILMNFASVLVPMIMARALGIMLRERKHELGLDS